MASHKSFFKPLETSSGGNNYFAQLNLSKTKENEAQHTNNNEQASGQERLSLLHSRLQQEAENIRKWKTHTEIDMKHKEMKLQDATQTIDTLRKSMLEIQLQNESLSLKLQEELGNREEIVSRINSTRDMCNLLKDYVTNVENRIQKCETEKTEVKYMEKEHMKELEELTGKFKELSVTFSREKTKIQQELNDARMDKTQLGQEYECALDTTKEELQSLNTECEEKTSQIEIMKQEMEKNNTILEELHLKYVELQSLHTTTSEEVENKLSQLEDTLEELNILKKSQSDTTQQLKVMTEKWEEVSQCRDKLSSNFDATEQLYVDKIKNLQDDLTSAQEALDSQNQRVKELETDIAKAQNCVEDLKCAKDMLSLEKTDALNTIKELEASCYNTKEQLQGLEQQLQCTNVEKNELGAELLSLRDEVSMYEIQVATLTAHVSSTEADITRLTSKIASVEKHSDEMQDGLNKALECERESYAQVDQLKSELASESEEREELSEKLSAMIAEKGAIEKKVDIKEKEIIKLKQELQMSSTNVSELRGKLTASDDQSREIQTKLAEMDEMAKQEIGTTQTKLKEEMSLRTQLEKKLESTNKKLSDMDSKMKKLKEDLAAKTKSTKETEKEMKSLRAQLTSQNKACGSLADASRDLQAELDEAVKQQETLQLEVNDMRQKMQQQSLEVEQTQQKMSELNEAAKKAGEEKDAVKMQCDAQLQKMNKAVEDYKEWYDKLVATKDKELEEANNKYMVVEQQMNDLTSKLDEMKNGCEAALDNKDSLEKSLQAGLAAEKKSYDKSLAKKQKEMEALSKKLEKAENKCEQSKSQAKEIKQQTKEIDALKAQLVSKDEKLSVMEKELASVQEELKTATTNKPAPYKPNLDIIEEDQEMSSDVSQTVDHCPATPKTTLAPQNTTTPQIIRKAPVKNTPKMNLTTPKPVQENIQVKTPSSILKQTPVNELLAIKRRKVAFVQEEDSDASSTSDFMEVEIDEGGARLKSAGSSGATTPLLIKPSGIPQRSPFTPTRITNPRSPSAIPTRPSQRTTVCKPHSSQISSEELFKQPTAESVTPKAKKTVDMRKAPAKNPGKFFKSSPLERQKQKIKGGGSRSEKVQDTSWFDMDATFGFGPED